MTKVNLEGGTVHTLPADLSAALTASFEAQLAWQGLTPLARNEWICWIITVKQQETRVKHLNRTIAELKEGKRRPCCWPGCPHRT